MIDERFVADVRRALAAVAVPEDAGPMQAYMKSDLPFLGVKKPARTTALRPVLRATTFDDLDDLSDTVLELWRGATHREHRYAAITVLRRPAHLALLDPSAMGLLDELVVTGAWWDLVDELAARVVGPVLAAHPVPVAATLRRWAVDDDLWRRRTSILAQLWFRDRTDLDLLLDCIEPSLDSDEFFLRKAIGWALRQHSRTDPDWVRDWVDANEHRLSGLSRREARKHLA